MVTSLLCPLTKIISVDQCHALSSQVVNNQNTFSVCLPSEEWNKRANSSLPSLFKHEYTLILFTLKQLLLEGLNCEWPICCKMPLWIVTTSIQIQKGVNTQKFLIFTNLPIIETSQYKNLSFLLPTMNLHKIVTYLDISLLGYGINLRILFSKDTAFHPLVLPQSDPVPLTNFPSNMRLKVFWHKPIFFNKPFPCGLDPTLVNHPLSSMQFLVNIVLQHNTSSSFKNLYNHLSYKASFISTRDGSHKAPRDSGFLSSFHATKLYLHLLSMAPHINLLWMPETISTKIYLHSLKKNKLSMNLSRPSTP